MGRAPGAAGPCAQAAEASGRTRTRIAWLILRVPPDLCDVGAERAPEWFLFLTLAVKDGVIERDTWGTDIVDELTPAESDPVIYKTRFSGFYRTELDELLREWGVKHLIVTGCTTSICVESTIRDAFFRDYHCILLEDCAAEPMGQDLSRSNHEASVHLVKRIFGSVSSSANFTAALDSACAVTA